MLKRYPNKKVSLDLSDSTFTSIGEMAFSDCTNLASITIPNSVKSIGAWIFQNCTSFTSVTIPSGVTSIGMQAFSGCTNLISVTFATGSDISRIYDYVFPEGSTGNGGESLKTAYNAASLKEGTYTREANGDTWSKQ